MYRRDTGPTMFFISLVLTCGKMILVRAKLKKIYRFYWYKLKNAQKWKCSEVRINEKARNLLYTFDGLFWGSLSYPFHCAMIVPWLCQGRFATGSISIGRSSFLSGLSVCLTLLTGTLIHHLPSLCPVDLVQCQQEKLLLQIFISLFMKSVALYKKYGARRKKEKQLEHSEISFHRFLKPFLNKWQCIFSWYFPLF